MINTIKADIEYILDELAVIRNKEDMKIVKNEALKYIDQEQIGFIHYTKDYRPYRSMVDTLIKNYDNLNKIYCYKLYEFEKEFVDKFLNNLTNETENLHRLKESCKGQYEQYRCLSDAYVKITDKICRIERDMPRKVESEYNPVEKNKELGLIQYQQDVVEFKGDNLICDWSRNAGKTFTIAKIIELNRPKNVLYIDSIGSEYNGINALYDKFIEINKLNSHAGRESGIEIKVKTATNLKLLVYNPMEEYSSEVSVYALSRLEKGEIDRGTVFDYVFFAECLPYNVGVKAKQSISFISYNDKDEWLERFYPNCKISKIDYRPLVEIGLLSQKMVDGCKESNYKKFCNEFAIND